jgi:uncharacterized protein (TIRG00374 family)
MKPLLQCVVTSALVGLIIWYLGGLKQIGESIVRIEPVYVPWILLVVTFDRALTTFKWAQLLRSRGLRLPFFWGMKIYCASMVWGMFLPSTIGADAYRAISVSRTSLNAKEVVASILIERMIGFLSALMLGLCGLVLLSLYGNLDNRFYLVWWFGSVLTVGTALVFAASFSQSMFTFLHNRLLKRFRDIRIMERLRQFHSTYQSYQNDKPALVLFFVLSFIRQLMLILQAWLIARGLGTEVGLLYIAGALPLAFLIARLPVSINGWGVFDGAFMLLLSLGGVPGVEAVAIALVSRILEAVAWFPWWAAHVLGSATPRGLRPDAEHPFLAEASTKSIRYGEGSSR